MMWFKKKKKEAFEQQIEGKEQHYTDEKFTNKLTASGGNLGQKAVYAALLLFEALKSSKLPTKTRLTILGALGYLILPADAVPDFLPAVGLADDAAIIVTALVTVYNMIDDDMRRAARDRMKSWFGDRYDAGQAEKELEQSL